MADRDKKNSSDEKPYGDSVELFEGMFKNGLEKMKGVDKRTPAAEVEDAGEEEERKPSAKKPDIVAGKKPSKPEEKPVIRDKKPSLETKKGAPKPKHKPVPREKKPVAKTKTKTALPEDKPATREKAAKPPKKSRPSGKKKKGKGSSTLKVILLAVFILLLGGVALNYLGVVDLVKLAGISGPVEESVTRTKIEKKPAGERVKQERTLSTAVTRPSTEVSPPVKESPVEEKPDHVGQPATRTIPEKKVLPPAERVSHPYSVLLGAFSTVERARDAVSRYEKEGLPTFYVKVDLGKKGIWFRIFTGHFKGKKEAEEFMNRRRLKGASVKRTRYAALIGSFSNKKELDEKRLMLSGLGYTPYVIEDANGWSYLFIGAFYTKIGAELQQQELAGKGIQSSAVER